MHNIMELATLVAKRAKDVDVRPNQVVLVVCKENGVHESEFNDIKKLILSECGRRGGSKGKGVKKPRSQHNAKKKPCQFQLLFGQSREEFLAGATEHERQLTEHLEDK